MKKFTSKDIVRRVRDIKPFIARDSARIFELFRPQNSSVKHMSIAAGFLEPRQKALPHFHKRSEEIYYILSGKGWVQLNAKRYEMQRGDAIYIAPRTIHALENSSKTQKLEILAISSPSYSDKDIFFV